MMTRRIFIQSGATVVATAAAMSVGRTSRAETPPPVVCLGIMGMQRGLDLARDLVRLPGVHVKYVCDVDQVRRERAARELAGRGEIDPRPELDFRQMLDDQQVDAIVCAAPNHWHGPATIMACQAGKHVYCEKPACHNPREGEWMVEAARKFARCVQIGTQRRSSPSVRAAIEMVHQGRIGRVFAARSDYSNPRPSIGRGHATSVPSTLDYGLWQGPAPSRPYRDNVVPYNWHWFWHWGNGELGNNGIHAIDLCRWGLGDILPTQITSTAGKVIHDDDQETPDVQTVGFEMPQGAIITWQGNSRGKREGGAFVSFLGTEGTLDIDADGKWHHFDIDGKLVAESPQSTSGQVEHLQNFLTAVRNNNPGELQQPVESGVASTLMCHLGNIAHRTGRGVHCHAQTGVIQDDREQMGLWERTYEPEWKRRFSGTA